MGIIDPYKHVGSRPPLYADVDITPGAVNVGNKAPLTVSATTSNAAIVSGGNVLVIGVGGEYQVTVSVQTDGTFVGTWTFDSLAGGSAFARVLATPAAPQTCSISFHLQADSNSSWALTLSAGGGANTIVANSLISIERIN